MGISTGREYPANLRHDQFGISDMLQDRVTLHVGEKCGAKRELLGIGCNVNPRNLNQVQIYVSRDVPARAADIEIPSA